MKLGAVMMTSESSPLFLLASYFPIVLVGAKIASTFFFWIADQVRNDDL